MYSKQLVETEIYMDYSDPLSVAMTKVAPEIVSLSASMEIRHFFIFCLKLLSVIY